MDLATRKIVYYGLLGLLIGSSAVALLRVAPQVLPAPFLLKDGTLAVYFNSVPSDIQGNQIMPGPPPGPAPDPDDPDNVPLSAGSLGTLVTSLNVTIDSIAVHESGGNDSGWTDLSRSPMTIDLLKATSVSVLIDSIKIPSENVTMVELHISNASAIVSLNGGSLVTVTVAVSSGNLRIPLSSGARVEPQLTTSVVVDRPRVIVEGNGRVVRITPLLNVNNVHGPD